MSAIIFINKKNKTIEFIVKARFLNINPNLFLFKVIFIEIGVLKIRNRFVCQLLIQWHVIDIKLFRLSDVFTIKK